MSSKLRPPVACIGAGRLARVVLPSLAAAGWPIVAVAASRRSTSRRLCRVLPGARAVARPGKAAQDAGLLLLAVPDREIAPLAVTLAEQEKIDWSERVVLHHAGSLGLEPLAPLARAGAAVGVLHPLQCLGHPRQARKLLPGSRARLEGRGRALSLARRVARDLGLIPLRFARPLSATDRAAYHTAAALLSNDLVAQLSLGVQMLETCGLDRPDAIAALAGLARGTLAQTETAGGLDSALTGPVVRGDVDVVAAHLEQLARQSPDAAEIHRLLSRRLLWLAEQAGSAPDPPTLRRLRRLLRRPAAGRRRTTTV
jgi:predicted short-subunit dehydrogenase-like oxidoreductase (DUF2520 family)